MAAIAAIAAAVQGPGPLNDLINIESRDMYRIRPQEETEEVRAGNRRWRPPAHALGPRTTR
jgi:hypothetical protein